MENMELLKAMQEMMDAYQAEMLAAIRASYEKMVARLEARLDAHHERVMTCIGKMEATAWEADSAELESLAEHREVPKEHSTVKSSGALKK
jgi:hypothetical protein